MASDSLYEYSGSIHVHSSYSDGLRTIPEIAEIASQVGIDFLLFADHMTLEPLKAGMERWFGSVLSIIGYEINDPDNKNHYLAYGLKEVLPPGFSAKEYVSAARDAGAIGFIAHPDEKRTAIPEIPPYPWTAWDVEGYDGIEIWNHSSEWLEKITHTNKYFRLLHPLSYLQGPEPETLERWDRLNLHRAMPGIGGTDAHAYPYRVGPVTIYIFRYKVLFRGIRTHVLLDEPLPEEAPRARDIIMQALKSARCYITNKRWGDSRGFRFSAVSGSDDYQMGDTIQAESAEFQVKLPLPGRISLLKNGVVVSAVEGNELRFSTEEPGAYRVEVKRKKRPWILSNHIRLGI
ncbi:MAG: histidinol-phosphatase [Candidatus Latescibacterota bacterium]